MIPCTLIEKRRGLSRSEVVLLMVLVWPSASQATNIYYDVSNISGDQWQYDYTVENTLADPIQEFTIYFDRDLYKNLAYVGAPPASWDPLVIQPDLALPSDGFFDALELGAGLPSSDTAGVFSVSFNYLGTDTPPSAQRFDVYDAGFGVLYSGLTSTLAPPPPPPSVPEPGTLAIMTLGLGLLAGYSRRSRKSNLL